MYAQYVKNTMEPLNIPDVRQDKRFPWAVSSKYPKLKIEYTLCAIHFEISYMTHLLLFFTVGCLEEMRTHATPQQLFQATVANQGHLASASEPLLAYNT